MVELNQISRLWKKNKESDLKGLVPNFKDLTEIKRYVSYLKEFKFNQASNQAGDFKSSFKGRGMEFEEVRSYTYGDDVRDIDWRVTARKNQPYTKLYAEEKDREVYIWLDLSSKMRFGTKNELKSVTAAKTAALLGWFALSNRDRLGIIVFDGNTTHVFKPKRDYENLLIVLKKIEQIAQESLEVKKENTDMSKSLQLLSKRIGKKSIVFLISSFDLNDHGIKHEISALALSNDMYIVNIYDVLEEIAPPKGEYLAEYRLKRQLLVNSGKTFEEQYHAYFEHKRQVLKDFCIKIHCNYRQIRTDSPIYMHLKPL